MPRLPAARVLRYSPRDVMRITPIIASTMLSDGGTTYAVVPKPLWQKVTPPDEYNRIRHHARSWLVELDDGRRGLLDTGCGPADFFSEKERALHGLGPGWPLMEALARLGIAPEQIEFVVLSHLHWDHVGGASRFLPGGGRVPAFPRAQHFVSRMEWEDATSGDPLFYKAYPQAILEPLRAHPELLRLVDDAAPDILPGIQLVRSSGHTRGHSVVVLRSERLELVDEAGGCGPAAREAVLASDVCPTRHHLRMVFQLSYDTYPLDTRRWKRAWLPRLAQERAVLLFDHDPEFYGGTIRPDEKLEFAFDVAWPVAGSPS
ncbi:MAG: MBL fold metallo-hydrolase [Verrucomicrobia bacterium]|nr:MAG: MBL fold metallo-hydrolase [Verrucomicrobiota bacterium]